MGTTAASLHLLLPPGAAADQSAALLKAYAKIGWASPKRGEAGQRNVVLARNDAAFVSIHDSDCAELDDGTLKELAAVLSKSLRTAAVVTSVYDSDTFEFILFANGKQVDAVTDASDGLDPNLKSVHGRRQAILWMDAFRSVQFHRATNTVVFGISDKIATFVSKARAAAELESVFSEDRLAAWCELAGLPLEAAVATQQEREARGDVIARLQLAARPRPNKAQAPEVPEGRTLRFLLSRDDCPYHGFFPAAWPVPSGSTQTFTWAVVCANGGLRRLLLRLPMERTGSFAIREIKVEALSFYNGQVMSPTALATTKLTIGEDDAAGTGEVVLDAPEFNLRDPAPGSRAQALLMINVRVWSAEGELCLRPVLLPDGDDTAPVVLPGLRLAVAKPAWLPVIAKSVETSVQRFITLLCLNAPAVHTAVAILPDEGTNTRHAVQRLAERLLAPLAGAGIVATISTEKHLTSSFRIPRASHTVPVADVTRAPLWPKLFDPEQEYQTVRIGLGPAAAPWPLAGLSMQTTLRRGRLLGLAGNTGETSTISVSVWAINNSDSLATLALDWQLALHEFTDWVRARSPLQGWVADCAWLPEFDTYEDYQMTPYEIVGIGERAPGEMRQSHIATLLQRRLKFVARKLWLGEALTAGVNLDTLSQIADLEHLNGAIEVTLKADRNLRELEQALAPILPFAS